MNCYQNTPIRLHPIGINGQYLAVTIKSESCQPQNPWISSFAKTPSKQSPKQQSPTSSQKTASTTKIHHRISPCQTLTFNLSVYIQFHQNFNGHVWDSVFPLFFHHRNLFRDLFFRKLHRLHNCTSITSTHHLKCWEARIHGLLASSKWISPGARELGPRGPGSWGASFIQIEVCSWFFGVIFGDVGDVFGIVTWDCCERFFGGMNLKGVVFLSDFGDVAFYYSGGSLGFFYESHVFDHLVRHDLCENTKKNTGWVDSWLLSLCSVWKSGSCTNIPCGAARFSVQCPPVCRENMRKQLVDKFWYVPLKLEIFQISFH